VRYGSTLAALALCGVCAALRAAHAADWKPILDAPGEYTVMIDLGSIGQRGATITASLRITYSRAQRMLQERMYRSAEQLWAFDCGRDRYALLQATNFAGPDATGEIVARYSWPQETGWRSTGSSGESAAILRYVCGHAPRARPVAPRAQ